jgi:hypothetical protein
VDDFRGKPASAELISKHFLGKGVVGNNSYRDWLWTYKNGILWIEGLVEIPNGEVALSSPTNTASGEKRNKDAQARASNAQESGMILYGQRIAQRMVRWELLGAREEPGIMDQRELEYP